jgi:soluble lytic murein transglycosylase-like protein
MPVVRTDVLEAAALSWHLPLAVQSLRRMRLLYDAPVPAKPALAVTRSILRSNPYLDPLEALQLASASVHLAQGQGLDYGFFAATLLQESAFEPRALSAAGAVGIAQFTLDTASDYGVDPFDPLDAMRGSARLLGDYVRAYQGVYPDPYATTLAAYNAGPGAVEHYGGVPPYPETKEYIALVYDRWGRIVRDATGAGAWIQ